MSTSEEPQRTEFVPVWLTQDEHAYFVKQAKTRGLGLAEFLRRGALWLSTDPWNNLLIQAGLDAGLTLEQIRADMHAMTEAVFDEVALEEREEQLREFGDPPARGLPGLADVFEQLGVLPTADCGPGRTNTGKEGQMTEQAEPEVTEETAAEAEETESTDDETDE